jgi:hypothetical protein
MLAYPTRIATKGQGAEIAKALEKLLFFVPSCLPVFVAFALDGPGYLSNYDLI